MGITVNITFSTPLSEEDDSILAGTAYWLHATAIRNGQQEVPSTGCGKQDPTRPTFYCVGADGHRGRHTYRDFGDGEAN